MGQGKHTVGIVLRCDNAGNIERIIRDELGVPVSAMGGGSFASLVDQGSIAKSANFLMEVKKCGAAFNWELNIPLADGVETLYFGGMVLDDSLLIAGAKAKHDTLELYQELMQMHNEQTNALRTALKTRVEQARSSAEQDNTLYNELSKLNNELITLQRELAKKNMELQRLDELKNQFLAIAAHDLRNPLDVILSYSEFLLDETELVLNKEHYEFLSIIHTSSQFMLQLVNDLLDISTIEAGKLELNLQPSDLIALATHNITLNNVLAKKKGLYIVFDYAPDLPTMLIDPGKINQVLNNLISNAIKYSHPDSRIEISITHVGEYITITIKDYGKGIPEDALGKLFKPFGRLSTAGTAGEKSVGLGLAICHKIIQAHQGKIWVESKQEAGSTFYVALPVPG